MRDLIRRLESLTEAKKDAPGYTKSTSEKKCANCRHFDKEGQCALYSFKPRGDFVCRSWRKRPQPPDVGDREKNVGIASL